MRKRGRSQVGWLGVVLRVLFVLVLVSGFLSMFINQARAVDNRPPEWDGPCTVRAHPNWNGPWEQEHTKYIDVFGVPPGGTFLYTDGGSGRKESIKLESWDGNGNRWTRYGIGTLWALTHPWWWKTDWWYTYSDGCDREKGY